eukprot:Lithocolla_globosa_v1_NODE_9903_length_657_cov_2.652824.p2 type:complete len:127 gc:universal NODE_9903_length_657_cov_2.652824:121-501(+)
MALRFLMLLWFSQRVRRLGKVGNLVFEVIRLWSSTKVSSEWYKSRPLTSESWLFERSKDSSMCWCWDKDLPGIFTRSLQAKETCPRLSISIFFLSLFFSFYCLFLFFPPLFCCLFQSDQSELENFF